MIAPLFGYNAERPDLPKLLRSHAPDPYAVLGRRTFLHPTVISAAIMPDAVRAHAGAPQTVYSDHFLDTMPVDGPLGFKLESAPIHPVIFSTTMAGYGAEHAAMMREFDRAHVLLALLRDGFHPDSAGGRVLLRDDGSPVLDYPLTPAVFDGIRRAKRSDDDTIEFVDDVLRRIRRCQQSKPVRNLEAAQAGKETGDIELWSRAVHDQIHHRLTTSRDLMRGTAPVTKGDDKAAHSSFVHIAFFRGVRPCGVF